MGKVLPLAQAKATPPDAERGLGPVFSRRRQQEINELVQAEWLHRHQAKDARPPGAAAHGLSGLDAHAIAAALRAGDVSADPDEGVHRARLIVGFCVMAAAGFAATLIALPLLLAISHWATTLTAVLAHLG